MTKQELERDGESPFSHLKNPTGKHKDWYTKEFLTVFCQQINPKEEYFSSKALISDYGKRFKSLELKDRLNLMAELLRQHIDRPYRKQLDILSRLFGDPWPHETGMFTYGFYLYPISQFIERFGTEDMDASIGAIETLTMQFTGEWAIRPLANQIAKTSAGSM
ncbi:MAG: hypothetical protein HRU19_00995 [Pseudobacteriovorax sp.]|nr:hypothetical protein [Pseudobacteriovorax sp.]